MGIVRHPTDEQFVLYHYGELDEAEGAAFRSHIRECEGCQRQLATLGRELAAVRPVSIPERPADYGARVWARLQPRLADQRARESKPARRWWPFGAVALRPLAYAAGLAVLVVAAFVAGRYWAPAPAPEQVASGTPASSTPSTEPGSEPELAGAPPGAQGSTAAAAVAGVRERILVLEVGEHLERSRAALLEVMNAPDEDGAIDLSADQERVRDLVAENRLYRLSAIDAGENGMAAVLDDLERALVEIANGPSRVSETEFEHVRGEIDAQGLIFKVGILGETLRQRQAKGSSI